MGNVFRVINCDGDIEISIYKKANAVFKTNEYNETEDVCIHKETINIFDLLKENQELKKQIEQYQEEVCILDMRTDENIKLINQQKEFIKYLENKIFILHDEMTELSAGMCNTDYQNTKLKIYQEVEQKYKETIGDVKNENNNI